MKMKLFLLLLSVICTASLYAQQDQFNKASSWEELFTKAKKENKLVFIDSYFVGCHACSMMDEEVFPLPEVMQFMNDKFISFKIDFFKEDLGKALQIKYAVTGFPTYLILNTDGKLVARFSGYKEADTFTNLLKDAVSKSEKGEVLRGFSNSLKMVYPDFYTAYFNERKQIDVVQLLDYLAKYKDLIAAEEVSAMPLFMGNLTPELSNYFFKNYYTLANLYGKELASTKRLRLISKKINTVLKVRDDQKFEGFLAEMQPYFSKEDWVYAKVDIAEAYYYNLHKDHKAFFKYAIANFNDDDNKVRYLGMYIHTPNVDEEEKQLYTQWMKLVLNENSSYEVLSSAAGLMMKQNDQQKAKEYATWGIKKGRAIKKDIKRFEVILAKIS